VVTRGTSRSLTWGQILRIAADVIMIQFALLSAIAARFLWFVAFERAPMNVDIGEQLRHDLTSYLDSAWPLTIISISVAYLSGFYTYGRAYQGRYKALIVFQAVSQSYLLFAFMSYFARGELGISRTALVLAWFFTVVLLVASRIWSQVWHQVVHSERSGEQEHTGDGRNVLVIGGAGYIGSALLPKLLDRGYRVRVLDLLVYGTEPIESVIDHPNLEVVQGDFRHVDKVVEAMHGIDSVVHLGAIVGDPACDLDEQLTVEVNLTATRMIAQVAKGWGANRFIFASTCSVYGAGDEVLDERSQLNPISLYGRTKLVAEKVLRRMADENFSPTIVRFSTIYGLSGRTRFDLVVNLLAAKAKTESKITVFGGDQWRPFVHVDDAAKAVQMILDAPRELVGNEVFNVGSDEQNYKIAEIGELVAQYVPTAELMVSEDATDLRNYRVSFAKIRQTLDYHPEWTVESGIQQVLEAIAAGHVQDYRDARYSNVKFLREAAGDRLTATRDDLAHELATETSRASGG